MSLEKHLDAARAIRSYFPGFRVADSMGEARCVMALECLGDRCQDHVVTPAEIAKVCDSFYVGIRGGKLVRD